MKNIYALGLIAGTTLTLGACGGIPKCNDYLDECSRGGPYTEERTVEGGKYNTVLNTAPQPAPAPAPVAEPTPVQPAPAPVMAPAPVIDTQIMRSAEPEFRQISK